MEKDSYWETEGEKEGATTTSIADATSAITVDNCSWRDAMKIDACCWSKGYFNPPCYHSISRRQFGKHAQNNFSILSKATEDSGLGEANTICERRTQSAAHFRPSTLHFLNNSSVPLKTVGALLLEAFRFHSQSNSANFFSISSNLILGAAGSVRCTFR